MRVLGIESSCDETAAAVVDAERTVLSNVVLSQHEAHAPYGGVVPEIAARSHIEHMDSVVAQALTRAGLGWGDIDGVAATTGPGLIGGVIVGAMTGKAIASVLGKPFVAVNHLEGHALTARLTHNIAFPYLLLLVSGGHCQILAVEGVGKYIRYGNTLDDALGEAFDKTAKLLGLGMPGGPQVEARAKGGEAKRFHFPMPMKGREGCDFSFSGLKTAVRNAALEVARDGVIAAQDAADICAAFQYTVGEVVKDRLHHAFAKFTHCYGAGRLVVAGGVAANQYLRAQLVDVADAHGFTVTAPPMALCTDNAAMIAWVGVERLRLGHADTLDAEPRARWPLGE
jgi:N6-L-threonylcarbamoyladenine synthase